MICLLSILLISQEAFAERILCAQLLIYKDDRVEEKAVYLSDGRPTESYGKQGDYVLRILDSTGGEIWKQDLTISFMSDDDFGGQDIPIRFNQNSALSYKIPYLKGMKMLELLHSGKKIFSKEIVDCDGNGKCQGTETRESCPVDCPITQIDHICTKEKDGACDPDCGEDVDPDCAKKEESGYVNYLLFAFPIILLAVAFIFYRKKQAQKIIKQREEFIKWKEEQELLKKAGKPSE
jgi:hypothetical protein